LPGLLSVSTDGAAIVWFAFLHLLGFVVDRLTTTRRLDRDKDVEILLLRHHLRLLQRERPRPPL
jgi:hypothetical protein